MRVAAIVLLGLGLCTSPCAESDSKLEVTVLGTTDSSFIFGKYNGLYDRRSWLDMGFTWSPVDAGWSLSGEHLGLDTREIRFELSKPGKRDIDIEYSEIYRRGNDTGINPFTGSSRQLLPAQWTSAIRPAGLDRSQFGNDLDLATRRQILTASMSSRLSKKVRLTSTLRLTNRQGEQLTTGTVYSSVANPLGVSLAAPVDEATTEAELRATFDLGRLSLEVAPRLIWFNNREDLLSWQNPYATGDPRTEYPAGFAGQSTAPDYSYRGLEVTGTYRLRPGLLLLLSGIETVTEQDGELPGYTVSDLLSVSSPRPLNEVDGQLETRRWLFSVKARPGPRSAINLTYLFRERDNTASRQAWNAIPGDGSDQPEERFAVWNRPLRHNTDRLTVEGSWRIASRTRLSLAWEYEEQYRNHAAVRNTELETWTFRVNAPLTAGFTASMQVSHANKAGTTYEWSRSFFQTLAVDLINRIPEDRRWLNHPLLRQYHLANHEDLTVSWQASWAITPEWQGQLSAHYRDVDFDRSELGLTASSERRLNLSLNRSFAKRGAAWFWIDARHTSSDQRGRDFGGGLQQPANRTNPTLPQGSDPTRDFATELDTDFISAGLGLNWTINDALLLELNYVGSDITQSHAMQTFGARDLAGAGLPDNHYRLHDLSTTLRYSVNPDMDLAFTYRYYRYETDNFQIEEVDPLAVDRLLWTGQRNPNEAVNLIGVSINYNF